MNNFNIMWRYVFFALLIMYGSLIQNLYAQSPATPDVQTVPFPQIIINEVSFKNSEQDWIELYVVDDENNGSGRSIEGLQIQDDSVFFKLEENIEVKTGEYIMVYFKSEQEKIARENDLLIINETKSGLTGTTEQIILKNNDDKIIDAICWMNSSPTQSETEETNELIENKDWHNDCIQSEDISSGESIGRLNFLDTNSENDWTIFTKITPGALNKAEEIIKEIETIIDDPTVEIITTQNISEDESECLSNIYISEISPNPPGKDTGNEWIELYNAGNELCELNGLIIDDQEGGSKKYHLTNNKTVNANGFLLLPSWETKINLNNTDDSVRLFLPDGELLDEIAYEKTYENKSFAISDDGKFIWTSYITPLLPNIIKEETEDEEEIIKKAEEKKSTKPSITNGTLSKNILLNEIFPNPKGTDKGNEWIEIFNNSNEAVNLGNWSIDTGEGSKKTFIFKNQTLNANSYLVLNDQQLEFSLKNTNGLFRLTDFQNTVIDTVEYDSAIENESYMRVKVLGAEGATAPDEELKWQWSSNPTPNTENTKLYIYKGEIIQFDEVAAQLTINDSIKDIIITVIEGGDTLLAQIFQEGTMIKVSVSKNNSDQLLLEEYEILESPKVKTKKNESQGLLYVFLSSIPPIGFLGYVGIRKWGLLA